VLGVLFGAYFVAPLIPPVFVRTSFTVLVSSMGVALLLVNREKTVLRNDWIPIFGAPEKCILIAAGFAGGVVSALVGTGENAVIFMIMVLPFRISEEIVTPTTVILMTMVTISGFLLDVFVQKDLTPTVMGYWLAAVPVVAIGAPAGALNEKTRKFQPTLCIEERSENRRFSKCHVHLHRLRVRCEKRVPDSTPIQRHRYICSQEGYNPTI
jgi:uncharacterized membrane protein YfcA